MAEVIVYTNSTGGVSVCYPTGELDISEVMAKDCPAGAIVVDAADLPQGVDDTFFDAWELVDGAISVNMTKAKAIATNSLNTMAKVEAQHRLTNASIGLDNKLSDADWLALLDTARKAISAARSTGGLAKAVLPVNVAIEENK